MGLPGDLDLSGHLDLSGDLGAARGQLGANHVPKVSSLGGLARLRPHTLARSENVGGPNLPQVESQHREEPQHEQATPFDD